MVAFVLQIIITTSQATIVLCAIVACPPARPSVRCKPRPWHDKFTTVKPSDY